MYYKMIESWKFRNNSNSDVAYKPVDFKTNLYAILLLRDRQE